ncbi:MAG TPA: hypothetical protein VGD95_08100 [Micavibrio sp.]
MPDSHDSHDWPAAPRAAADPQMLLEEWRAEVNHDHDPDHDPADIIAAAQDRQAQLAALETFMTLDKVSGNKYGKGLRYLFALHVEGESAAEIAARENTTPEIIEKAVKDTCAVLRPVLGSLLHHHR